ncbi:serine/threonine protein kinase [Paenibacillus sp. CFBP13512]|uniref:protein kinase domain-containing protein n=1 Tax=Paenibacillus sp. CFBP13512 TaxID=2184007 RepID=UPI0010C09CE7|nr:protein kinase [Paenibacillus sp. CFBP13512]TKJ85173.1 serine/threonine protein kinase [Paenibacillus sp. CFBP13512]
MSISTNSELPPGTMISGRTRGQQYMIQRVLGTGTNGTVYLVSALANGNLYALKMGAYNRTLQAEIKLLFSLHKHWKETGKNQVNRYLYDADDYEEDGLIIPFYVMKYVKGQTLSNFLRSKGSEHIGKAGLGVLEILRDLHEADWVFGDLKAEHVIITDEGQVELIDYGGASQAGRSLHQFTEWYDRKFWKAGSRTGDYAYDLFAFAVMCIKLFNEPGLQKVISTQLPQIRSSADLVTLVDQTPRLKRYAPWLKRALRGEFDSTGEAYHAWKAVSGSGVLNRYGDNGDPVTRRLKNALIWSIIILGITLLIALFFTK